MKKILLSVAAALSCMALQAEATTYNVSLTVPYGDEVFMGAKTKHFVPFTEQDPVEVENNEAEGKSVYRYDLPNGSGYSFKVSSTDNTAEAFKNHVSYAQKFKVDASTNMEVDLTGNNEDSKPYLDVAGGEVKTYVNRDLQANSTYNVADVYVNGTYSGYNKLNKDETFQIVNLRNWEITNNVIENYFIEPDYHYTVLNENFEQSEDVISVDENGLVTAKAPGVAFVLVRYDALKAPEQLGGADVFSSTWAENTGLMVFSVDAAETNIVPSITINEETNTDNTQKVCTVNVDAELDVFYYLKGQSGYNYSFTPQNATKVEIANPVVDKENNTLNYKAFAEVAKNEDGSYTLCLTEGRNIVKISNADGSEYYVMKAKEVEMSVSPEKPFYEAGDEVTVVFNTLFHPVNKLAGVYNMYAQVEYTDTQTQATVSATRIQYNFAANAKAQTLTFTLGETDNDEYVLANGVIHCTMWGDPYGGHRDITYTDGKNPNFNASSRNAVFGALPEIRLATSSAYTQKAIAAEGDVVLDLSEAVNSDDNVAVAYNENGCWTRCYDVEAVTGVSSQIYSFAHYADDTYGSYYSGYVPANNGDDADYSAESWYGTHEWGNMAGGGVKPADEYSVFVDEDGNAAAEKGLPYMVLFGSSTPSTPDKTAYIDMGGKTVTPKGVYVAMNPITYYSVLNGDGYNQAFDSDDDYFDLIAVGYNANGQETGRATMKLAGYDTSKGGLQVSTKWQWLDLSALGNNVCGIDFCFNGSDVSQWGLNTPCYVNLDKLVVTPAQSSDVIVTEALQQVVRVRSTLYNVPANSCVYVYSIGGALLCSLENVEGEVVLPRTGPAMIIKVVSAQGVQTLR